MTAPGRPSAFASLRIRNYRLYFAGQLVSVTGSWLQSTAQAWLVLKELDGSGGALGALAAFTFAPSLVLGLWAGVVADRFDRRRILVTVQAAMAVVAAAQAVVVLTGVVELWMVYGLAAAMGTANAFEMPTRQAFVAEMVSPGNVANAVGLNSATFNSGRVVGPALGGALIPLVGTGWCFAANAVSFLGVIAGLARMRVGELHPVDKAPRAKGQIREGLAYAWASPALRSTLALVALVGTFTLNWTVVLPLLAKETFGGGAGLVGALTSALGVGALVGALGVARRAAPTRRLLVGAAVLLGLAELGAAASPTVVVAGVMIAVTGFAFMTLMLSCNAMLQLNSVPSMRGRVMATYAVLLMGTTPIGGPTVGIVSDWLGARAGAGLGGIASLGGAAVIPVAHRAAERSRARAATAPAAPGVATSGTPAA